MTQIELTKAQLDMLKNELAEVSCTGGKFDIDVVMGDDLNVNASGWVEIDGYREDDYQSGTGAFVETYRNAHVELKGWAYDHLEEEDVEVEIGTDSTKIIENFLNAA